MSTAISTLISSSSNVLVSTERLLRATLVVASAAGDELMCTVCKNELAGYNGAGEDLPNYRRIPAELMSDNGYTPLPIRLGDSHLMATVSVFFVFQPMAMVQGFADRAVGSFSVELPHGNAEIIRRWIKDPHAKIFHKVQAIAFQQIVASVRHMLFEWAIKNSSKSVTLPAGLTVEEMLGLPRPLSSLVNQSISAGMPPMNIPGNHNTINLIQGSTQVSINQNRSNDIAPLQQLLSALENALSEASVKGGLSQEEMGNAQALVDEVKYLTTIPNPRPGLVRATIDGIIEMSKATTSAIAAELLKPSVVTALTAVSAALAS
ncbi:MAG: hypothetical protein EON54_12205 [Alcaligenaceae bacterium]|nr:MAG: hypothetical protein EON54_12205 [Alcaligenaceae bacterium]